VPIVDTAIRRIYFKVSRKHLACDGNGLIPPHFQITYHYQCLSPTIRKYTNINTSTYLYSTLCIWLVICLPSFNVLNCTRHHLKPYCVSNQYNNDPRYQLCIITFHTIIFYLPHPRLYNHCSKYKQTYHTSNQTK